MTANCSLPVGRRKVCSGRTWRRLWWLSWHPYVFCWRHHHDHAATITRSPPWHRGVTSCRRIQPPSRRWWYQCMLQYLYNLCHCKKLVSIVSQQAEKQRLQVLRLVERRWDRIRCIMKNLMTQDVGHFVVSDDWMNFFMLRFRSQERSESKRLFYLYLIWSTVFFLDSR